MIATASTKSRTSFDTRRADTGPDLGYFRRRYPELVTNFGALPRREEWLRRIWELDERWQKAWETHGGESPAEEAIVRGAPPAGLSIEGEFDIIYAGGVLGLLHAAVMASRYKRRVLVFDAHDVGRTHRDWNISDEELREFGRAGLFTQEEIERAVVNRYRAGFVKFHDAASRVKAERLWMNGVLDVAVDADTLLRLAAEKLRARGPDSCALMDGVRFVRAYVEPHRVTVEVEDVRGVRRLFAARLFVDSTGTNSAIARQLNGGRAMTHVCPTVGTVASGFVRGEDEPDKVDFSVGEILVSTEDASEHRQLIWEGFAGAPARDEYTTYLFFYDAVDSPADKSLLSLFERYFASLAGYKRAGAGWRVRKPVFGYIPSFHRQGWRKRKRTSDDRVMLVGDSAGLSSPLTFCGFGSHVRNLRRLTHLTNLALEADLTDAASLSEVSAYEPRVAQMASLAEFLRPAPKGAPGSVNETLNAVMAALHTLDERVRRELFQDRMTFGALKSLLGHTAKLYPRIFTRVREHLGARGTLWWVAGIAEAVLSERRGRAAALTSSAAGDGRDAAQATGEGAAHEFARHVALYKNGNGAGDFE
jgi:lycopene cyclase CruA